MTRDDALKQLSHIARERAFGRHVGSERLIQAGLDALIAGVESPSLAMLAGLLRSEEPEADGGLVIAELQQAVANYAHAPDKPNVPELEVVLTEDTTWTFTVPGRGVLGPPLKCGLNCRRRGTPARASR